VCCRVREKEADRKEVKRVDLLRFKSFECVGSSTPDDVELSHRQIISIDRKQTSRTTDKAVRVWKNTRKERFLGRQDRPKSTSGARE
jgi:hypothetical protein